MNVADAPLAAQPSGPRYAERLHLLREIDHAILESVSVAEIARSALPRVRDLLGCAHVSLALFDLERRSMHVVGGVGAGSASDDGASDDGATDEDRSVPLDARWPLEALARGEIHTWDGDGACWADPPGSALHAAGVCAWISVPLVERRSLLGALNIGLAEVGALPAEDDEIVREVALQLAIGIQHARLYASVQRYAETLEGQVARRTAALQASEARFRAMFEAAGIGIAALNAAGRVVQSNPALVRMAAPRDLHGARLRDLLPPPQAEEDARLFAALLRGERDVYRLRSRMAHASGRPVWVHLTVSRVLAPSSRASAIAMIEDVTEEREAQQAMIRAEKLALTGRLAASLAHEINNPLQTVIGCLGLAEETLEGQEEVRVFLTMANDELRRAARIVAQLRDLNRPAPPEQREPVDLEALARQVLALTASRFQDGGLHARLESEPDLPSVLAASDRIEQVFLNLTLNALDALAAGGALHVRLSRTADPPGVTAAFADSGGGVDPEIAPSLFEPFQTTKPEGLGLGLFISRSIVEDHGGRIEVESEPGRGSTFRVWLPLDQAQAGGHSL